MWAKGALGAEMVDMIDGIQERDGGSVCDSQRSE